MATENSDLDLQVLLKIAGQVDPSTRAAIEQTIDQLTRLGASVQQVNSALLGMGKTSFPDILRDAQAFKSQLNTIAANLPKGSGRGGAITYGDVPGMPIPAGRYPANNVKGGREAVAEFYLDTMRKAQAEAAALQATAATNFQANLKEAQQQTAQQTRQQAIAARAAEIEGTLSGRYRYRDVPDIPRPANLEPTAFVSKANIAQYRAEQEFARREAFAQEATSGILRGNPRGVQGPPLPPPVVPEPIVHLRSGQSVPLSQIGTTAAAQTVAQSAGPAAAGVLEGIRAGNAFGPQGPFAIPTSRYRELAASQNLIDNQRMTDVMRGPRFPPAQPYTPQTQGLLKAAEQMNNSAAANSLEAWAEKMQKLGKSTEETDRQLMQIAVQNYPKVWDMYAGSVGDASKKQDEWNKAAEQGNTFGKALQSGLEKLKSLFDPSNFGDAFKGVLQSLQRIAEYVAGNLIANGIRSIINEVRQLGQEALQAAADFVKGGIDINAQLEVMTREMEALLGGSKQAQTAINFIQQQTIKTPFFDVSQVSDAVRIMTAFGLDYQQWYDRVAATSIAFNKPIEQVVRAIGQLQTGATGRALLSLRLLGINVRDAGVQFDSANHAIGTTSELVQKISDYIDKRFVPILGEVGDTWKASVTRIQNTFALLQQSFTEPIFSSLERIFKPINDFLTAKDASGLNQNVISLQGFFQVLGEIPARGIDRFMDFFRQASGIMNTSATDFFEGAVKLVVAFADGIMTGFEQYVVPAVEAIVNGIADFLIGHSPPPKGPLAGVVEGAMAVIAAYSEGLKKGLDYSALNDIGGLIASALSLSVEQGMMKESVAIEDQLDMRNWIGQALQQIQQFGSVFGYVLDAIRANFGSLGADIANYLDLIAQINAATKEQEAAEKAVEQATKDVNAAQEKLRMFELLSAEIPERYTRGRKLELELELKGKEDAQKSAQESAKAAADKVKELQKQAQALQNYFQELEKVMELERQRLAALKKEGEDDTNVNPAFGRIDETVQKAIDAAKKRWEEWFSVHVWPEISKLEVHFSRIGEIIRGFLGLTPNKGFEDWYKQGEQLRKSIEGIIANLPKLVADAKRFSDTIGGVLPILGDVLGAVLTIIDKMTEGFNSLPDWAKDLIKKGLVVVTLNWILGGLPGGILALLASALGMGASSGALAIVASGIFMTIAVGLVFDAVASLVGFGHPVQDALKALFTWDDKRGGWSIQVVIDYILDPKKSAEYKAKTGKSPLEDIVSQFFGNVQNIPAVGGIINQVEEQLTKSMNDLFTDPAKKKQVETNIDNFFDSIRNPAKKAKDDLVGHSIIPDMVKEIIGWFGQMRDLLGGIGDQIGDKLTKPFADAASATDYMAFVWADAMNNMAGWADYLYRVLFNLDSILLQVASDAAAVANISVSKPEGTGTKGAANGMPYVPQNMLLQVHKGEAVLNASQNAALRSGGKGWADGMGLSLVQNFEINVPITRADELWLRNTVREEAYNGVAKVMDGIDKYKRSS